MVTIADVITKAAARLRSQGWRTKSIGPKHAETCVIGAVLWSCDDIADPRRRATAQHFAMDTIVFELVDRGLMPRTALDDLRPSRQLIIWNDAQGDIAVVLDVLDAAARREFAQKEIPHG